MASAEDSRRILSSGDDLEAQEKAVWAAYVMASSSSKALSVEFPQAAAKRAVDAELLRAAAMSLSHLRLNCLWIESGLQARLVDRRQAEIEARARREAAKLR